MKVSLSKTVIGIALSSLIMGCQTTAVTDSTKPVIDSDTSAVEKTIINKDNTNPLPATASSPLLLYYFKTLYHIDNQIIKWRKTNLL